MISFEPNIVIIDDKKNEVEGIINYYQGQGIGCKFFNANLIEGDVKPSRYYCDLTLIYLDIHFTDNFHDYDPELCTGWIQSLIPENTFYVLIIWTKEVDKANEIITELERIKRLPYCHIEKSKSDYVTAEGYDFQKLNTDISLEMERTPAFSELQVWKKNIVSTSNLVIGHLSKKSDPSLITNRLKKIIISHGGTSIIRDGEFQQKRSILFDALDSILISNTKKKLIADEISELNNINLYNLSVFEPIIDIDKELNSWFHFKLEKELKKDLICTGLIAKNNDILLKKIYSIQDDPKLIPILAKQKQENIEISDIVLVINRTCDIAQNKFGKNIKLLSGIMLRKAFRHTTGKNRNNIHFNDLKLPDSIVKYDHLYFDDIDDDIALLFDLRYSFSIPLETFIEEFENIKVFNKEVLSEIQVEYSSYSSRLGITQII